MQDVIEKGFLIGICCILAFIIALPILAFLSVLAKVIGVST